VSAARYPTTYTVTYVCGHRVQRDLREFEGKKRAGRAKWESEHWKCTDCLVAEGQQSKTPQVTSPSHDTPPLAPTRGEAPPAGGIASSIASPPAPGANEWFQRRRLPPLNGSPRQVESATRIRSQMLTGAWAILAAANWEENEFVIAIETSALQVLSAKWWLDNKSIAANDLSDALEAAARAEKGVG